MSDRQIIELEHKNGRALIELNHITALYEDTGNKVKLSVAGVEADFELVESYDNARLKLNSLNIVRKS